MKPVGVSVVICTHNRHDLLADAIESVLQQDYRNLLEVIVVDNSSDQTAARAFGGRYEGRVLYLCEPLPGLSRARNIGVHHSRHPIVAFMDDDAVAAPGWVQKLADAFGFGDNVGVTGGRIIPIWPTEKPHWISTQLAGYLSVVDWDSEIRPLRDQEWLAGCNVAFRKDFLLRGGGFSENLGRRGEGGTLLSNEEIEVVERIRKAGAEIVYTPFAEVHHRISADRLTPEWFYKRAAWQAVSDFLSKGGMPAEHSEAIARQYEALFAAASCDDMQARVKSVYDIVAVCLAGSCKFSNEENASPA